MGDISICVPSVSNVFPRRWYPPVNPDTKTNFGDFHDGFGNKITVLAVSNPTFTGREPSKLYDRATGYGIVKFNRDNREITMENWPRDADPSVDTPYEGWPIVINQMDNFRPPQGAYLPLIKSNSAEEPLLQALSSDGTLVWSVKIPLTSTSDFKVPTAGIYILRATVNNQTKDFTVTATTEQDNRETIVIDL